MTPWQFMACLDGYARANGWKSNGSSGAADDLTDADLRAMGIAGF
ncbi:hypothetical protein [Paracoccus haematequi]|nr:hypothetical protein [Paracoccus haematequi]